VREASARPRERRREARVVAARNPSRRVRVERRDRRLSDVPADLGKDAIAEIFRSCRIATSSTSSLQFSLEVLPLLLLLSHEISKARIASEAVEVGVFLEERVARKSVFCGLL